MLGLPNMNECKTRSLYLARVPSLRGRWVPFVVGLFTVVKEARAYHRREVASRAYSNTPRASLGLGTVKGTD